MTCFELCHPERSEAESKDLIMFDVLLIYKILRHFVSQNDSVVFTEKVFVNDLGSPGR